MTRPAEFLQPASLALKLEFKQELSSSAVLCTFPRPQAGVISSPVQTFECVLSSPCPDRLFSPGAVMAFLDIINLPSILGTDTHSFKRANLWDKLDLGLAATVGVIGAD